MVLSQFVSNASGCWDTTLKELQELAAVSDRITLKSTTYFPRAGNPEPRYSALPHGTIQRMGLPNVGLVETLKNIDAIARPGLHITASIAGAELAENNILMRAFQKSKVNAIEINGSCPNTQRPTIALEFDELERQLSKLNEYGDKPIGLKLPYYGDLFRQNRVVNLAKKYGLSFLTAINSIPGLVLGDHGGLLSGDGVGGVGGAYIKPFALLECRNYAQLLKGTGIKLIGVGGIASGLDAYHFMQVGCDAVQVGSYLQENGPECLPRINKELFDGMPEDVK